MTDGSTTRFLGGSPVTVLIRLGVVSLLVGALMSWLGIDVTDLFYDLRRGFEHLYGTGFAALRDVARTLMAGAAIVIPIWLVLRVFSYRAPFGRPPLGQTRADLRRDDAGSGDHPYAKAARWADPDRRA